MEKNIMRSVCNSYHKWTLSAVDAETKFSTTKGLDLAVAHISHYVCVLTFRF